METNKNALGTGNGLKPIETGDSCGCLKLSSFSRCLCFLSADSCEPTPAPQYLRHVCFYKLLQYGTR